MMKTSELMVGDWVKITDPDPYQGYVGKVLIINGVTGYITLLIDAHGEHDVLCDDLIPIDLTSEILEKNEFGFCDVHDGYYAQHGGVWKGWWICDSKIELAVEDHVSKWPVYINIPDVNIRCDYVHQLQHAMKLCRMTREIKL